MIETVKPMDPMYEEYLHDESRLSGWCESISFPSDAAEAIAMARALWKEKIPVTVQGARTGICGGAVPAGGHLMSLEKLDQVLEIRTEENACFLTVEPGLHLSELASIVRSNAPGCFFPPNPTETSSTMGGAFACNAKGINFCAYGSVSDHVEGVRLLTPDGAELVVRRGECVLDSGGCTLPDGRRLELSGVPEDNGGFSGFLGVHQGADLVDVLAGSEGMLGIVLSLEVKAVPRPAEQWGTVFFFSSQEQVPDFIGYVRALREECGFDVRTAAVEFFHATALGLSAELKRQVTRLDAIPDYPAGAVCAVYVELEGDDPDQMGDALLFLLEQFIAGGGKEEDTWAGTGEGELEKFRLLRHSVPEAANARINALRQEDDAITKLAADFTAPVERLEETIALYEGGFVESGLEGAIFGHMFENHLHVNLLPRNRDECDRSRALLKQWAETITQWGGCVLSENGVGKLKRELLTYADSQRLACLRQIRNFFDPQGLLNPGNML